MRLLPLAALVLGLLAPGCAELMGGVAGRDRDALAMGYALDCGVASPAPWPERCLAHASPNESPGKTEIDLAVNPLDPNNVVVGSKDLDPLASDCVWAVPQVSKDGGKTWKTVYIGGKVADRKPGDPLYGWHCITDPIMAFDAKGVLYYSLQAYEYGQRSAPSIPDPTGQLPGVTLGSAIYMARSRDGGETWDKIITLHAGDGTGVYHDYMRMATNPRTGSIYTIWNQYSQQVVVPVLVASRDGGETAERPVYIPIPDSVDGTNTVMSGLAVARDGTVYVALVSDNGDVWFTKSTDDARSFETPERFLQMTPVPRMLRNNTFRTGSGVELAVDNSGVGRDGAVYATYADFSFEDPNVYVLRSRDKGSSWTQPVRIHADAAGDQWMDRPWVDGRGTLHVVFLDRARDPAHHGIDATWAASTDGGETWTNVRLTDRPFDGALGLHQDGFPFIGDYLGIGSAGDALYLGFPTTATGRAEVAVAKVRIP